MEQPICKCLFCSSVVKWENINWNHKKIVCSPTRENTLNISTFAKIYYNIFQRLPMRKRYHYFLWTSVTGLTLVANYSCRKTLSTFTFPLFQARPFHSNGTNAYHWRTIKITNPKGFIKFIPSLQCNCKIKSFQ